MLSLVAQGKTNPEISGDLAYSLATIRLDVRKVAAKLGASDRHQAAKRAIEIGLIPYQ